MGFRYGHDLWDSGEEKAAERATGGQKGHRTCGNQRPAGEIFRPSISARPDLI